MAFCKKLSDVEGKTYRLPTEAEWEYACRAGTTTAFSFGDDETELNKHAWWGHIVGNGNADNHAHEVALKLPNSFNLYDMHGNVLEWCSDWYGQYASNPMTDPPSTNSESSRVLRGGSWSGALRRVRCARRNRSPGGRSSSVGFRVVSE